MEDVILELVGTMELALRYIEHPDVQAMSFALPASCVAKRMRSSIAKAEAEIEAACDAG